VVRLPCRQHLKCVATRATKLWPALMSVNQRLTSERADFLSRSVSYLRSDGLVAMACDPWHKIPSPTLLPGGGFHGQFATHHGPVLMLVADQGFVHQRFSNDAGGTSATSGLFQRPSGHHHNGCGHNIQHDQPEQVAAALTILNGLKQTALWLWPRYGSTVRKRFQPMLYTLHFLS